MLKNNREITCDVNAKTVTIDKETKTFATKSDIFRALYTEAELTLSEIAQLTDSHTSFVHGIVSKMDTYEPKKNTNTKTRKVQEIILQNPLMSVTDIVKELADNSNYSFIYSISKKFRQTDEYKDAMKNQSTKSTESTEDTKTAKAPKAEKAEKAKTTKATTKATPIDTSEII